MRARISAGNSIFTGVLPISTTFDGWGANVRTHVRACFFPAISDAVSMTRKCPRCSPSNIPIAKTQGRLQAFRLSKSVRMLFIALKRKTWHRARHRNQYLLDCRRIHIRKLLYGYGVGDVKFIAGYSAEARHIGAASYAFPQVIANRSHICSLAA